MDGSSRASRIGKIEWYDLTVDNADSVRDFYQQVVGWTVTPVEMKGYNDYCMNAPDSGEPVVGVCHQRDMNQGLPNQWLLYINVDNLEQSLANVRELGGTTLTEIKSSPQGSYCVIEDPAGAVCALFEPPQDES